MVASRCNPLLRLLPRPAAATEFCERFDCQFRGFKRHRHPVTSHRRWLKIAPRGVMASGAGLGLRRFEISDGMFRFRRPGVVDIATQQFSIAFVADYAAESALAERSAGTLLRTTTEHWKAMAAEPR